MVELPTGTVTFLFTDLEGSTRLWDEHPDHMKDALARHDVILRGAVEAHRGAVVKTTGDGIHAVFATAQDAVAGAVEAQRGLVSESWRETGPLRVRMGLHTGEAEQRDGDYYGGALNRAARLMSAAHGGQVLASEVTAGVVREGLPARLSLVDLGEHRLRDLSGSVRVFQVADPALPQGFPPLRSLDAFPGNLPLQLTSFVGRDAELASIAEEFGSARLVTLTGVGGVGKTRLAVQVGASLLPEFSDGTWLCELATAGKADAIAEVIAAVLAVQRRPDVPLALRIRDSLASRRLLLVLDNCEHVLDATCDLVDGILHECDGVRILATSREPLGLPGERVIRVRSLELPSVWDDVEYASTIDAVRLFVERARAAEREFVLGDANVGAVVEICRRLDGMPLAIELAASQVASLSPAEVASLLDERFRLLTGGRRGAVERHQ